MNGYILVLIVDDTGIIGNLFEGTLIALLESTSRFGRLRPKGVINLLLYVGEV